MRKPKEKIDKAIVIIDMPKHCYECPMEHDLTCTLSWKEVESLDRPEWCPLKPTVEAIPKEFIKQKIDEYLELGLNSVAKELNVILAEWEKQRLDAILPNCVDWARNMHKLCKACEEEQARLFEKQITEECTSAERFADWEKEHE